MSRNLYLLNKLKYYVKADARKLFFHAHCMSILNYASTVWSGAADVHIQKLDSLYNRGAKLILFEKSLASSEKLRLLDMLPLKEHFKYCKAVFMFKVDRGRSPSYLKGFLNENKSMRCGSKKYNNPQVHMDLFKTSFAFSGSVVWRFLPQYIRDLTSLRSFKLNVRKHLMPPI